MAQRPFGKYIRDRRCAAKLTLRDVADRLGVSHVFVSEIERGERAVFAKERWPDLVRAIPGVTLDGLERASALTVPVQLDLTDAPEPYQDLGLALARRIENRDLNKKQVQTIIEFLRGDKK